MCTAANMPIVARIALDTGSTIRDSTVRSLAPSRRADSRRASGIAWKLVRMMTMYQTLKAAGSTKDHMVSRRPSEMISR